MSIAEKLKNAVRPPVEVKPVDRGLEAVHQALTSPWTAPDEAVVENTATQHVAGATAAASIVNRDNAAREAEMARRAQAKRDAERDFWAARA